MVDLESVGWRFDSFRGDVGRKKRRGPTRSVFSHRSRLVGFLPRISLAANFASPRIMPELLRMASGHKAFAAFSRVVKSSQLIFTLNWTSALSLRQDSLMPTILFVLTLTNDGGFMGLSDYWKRSKSSMKKVRSRTKNLLQRRQQLSRSTAVNQLPVSDLDSLVLGLLFLVWVFIATELWPQSHEPNYRDRNLGDAKQK